MDNDITLTYLKALFFIGVAILFYLVNHMNPFFSMFTR